MSLNIRRVVTGHDGQGRAKILIDETVKNVTSQRPGALYSVIWSSEGFPVSNDGDVDPSGKKIGTTIPNGTVFRIVSFGPGVAPRNHRTDSIDYAVVMSGEIDMDLDGTTVHLKAGDVLVQRGTIHNWINKGTEPCVIAFTLVSAKSASAGGKTLLLGDAMRVDIPAGSVLYREGEAPRCGLLVRGLLRVFLAAPAGRQTTSISTWRRCAGSTWRRWPTGPPTVPGR